jgi:exodeoxyribonuclease V beta subunit
MKDFDVLNIELEGKNLIEASAGTGKTYSVTMMALRLILEKEIPVNQILMVTFTEAAAAEMAERLVKFISIALEKAKGNKISDQKINSIVQHNNHHLRLLEQASLSCDELKIFTIHGFCNKTLTEFAFESNQSFGYEITNNDQEVFQEVFNQFWRNEIILNRLNDWDYSIYKSVLNDLIFKSSTSPEETLTKYIFKKDSDLNNSDQVYYLDYFLELSNKIRLEVAEYKNKYQLLSYDDLILRLFEVTEDNDRKIALSRQLQKKYKAVFIDEFQDTDKYQFEIFSKLFPDTAQFYVGDPKQSIYSFRGADLDTYLKVKNQDDVICSSMNTNFRSSKNIIKAVNRFYSLQKNPFNNEMISYKEVFAHQKESLIIDKRNDRVLNPMSIKFDNYLTAETNKTVVNRVLFYLNHCSIKTEDSARPVKPEDIVVLCRTKKNSALLREALIQQGVPAVTVDGTNVLSSNESDLIQDLLRLLIQPDRNLLLRVLISNYMGYSPEELKQFDFSTELLRIKSIKSEISRSGIFTVLHQLVHLYHREEIIKKRFGLTYNRMKSNVLQLIDLIHSKVTGDHLNYEMLPVWISREKDKEAEGGFTEQRLESDENAVKLLTIHKSKGLEFGITIVPIYKSSFGWSDEDLRVNYVAITRAKYKVDIVCSKSARSSQKEFISILNSLNNDVELFDDHEFHIDEPEYFNPQEDNNKIVEFQEPLPNPINKSWKITSYSALAIHEDFIPKNEEIALEDYDKFVFEEMPKGPFAGVFLHSLFENADFCSEHFLEYLGSLNNNYISKTNIYRYNQFLNEVLQADFSDIDLTNISNKQRLNEFEYHLKLKENTSISALSYFLKKEGRKEEEKISGLLKGFIDLVFEYDGKYYLLDWKSNYLGNTLDAYSEQNMKAAMEANSYDLQYHIYSIALCRYLEQRITDFSFEKHFGGGFWVFLRGCRNGQKNGVYHIKPDKNIFDELSSLFQ